MAVNSLNMKKFLLSFCSFIFAFLLGEMVLRFFWVNPYRNEPPDHIVSLRLHHPNRDSLLNRGRLNMKPAYVAFRTDGRSYIRPSFQHKEPDRTIAFLGGSTTECAVVKENLRFPALVSDYLKKEKWKINTLNSGYSGNTTHDSVTNLLQHVINDRPDFAVMMHVVNDVGMSERDPKYRSRQGHFVRVGDMSKWLLQMGSYWSYSLAVMRMVYSHPVFVFPSGIISKKKASPEEMRPFLQRVHAFVGLCQAFGIHPILMTQPLTSSPSHLTPNWTNFESQEIFNQAIRKFASETKTTLFDLEGYIKTISNWSEPMNLFYDGMHVTDKGSKIYAKWISRQFLPFLMRKKRGI